MANKTIIMTKLRQILRYHTQGKSKLLISRYTGVSRNTVKLYIRKFEELHLGADDIAKMNDHELDQYFAQAEPLKMGNNSTLDTITFADEFDIKTKQGTTYLIVIVNFDKKDPPAGTADGNCADYKNCGDEFCSFNCGEDSNNCKTGECKDRYHLYLNTVTLEEDVKYTCSPTEEKYRESRLKGKYAINFQAFVYHCNGSSEYKPPTRFSKWKRRELVKTDMYCNNQGASSSGTRTPKTNVIDITHMFKPWGGNKSDKIYIMFYEDDPRRDKSIGFTAINNGHQTTANLLYNCAKKEPPYGYKTPEIKQGDMEPVPNQGWNHIIEIKGSDFVATGPYTGSYTYNDPPNGNGRGTKYGLSFTLTYIKEH